MTLQCFSLSLVCTMTLFLVGILYKDLGVMALIFVSSKPTLIMFYFGSFSWFNSTLYFTFPFEFLAKMMKFLALFAGVAWHGIWPRKPWLGLKRSTGNFFENYHKWHTVWLFFKTEFWRTVVICQHDNENLWLTTL